MELTKAQRDFFADLDLDSATKAGEGKVHFNFAHKDYIVEVAVYGACEADITVNHKPGEGLTSGPCMDLTLLNIPGTENVSGPAVLRMVYEAANKPEYSILKKAWLDTPYVELWPVDVMGSRVKFSYQDGPVCYELWASKSQEITGTATVELLVDCELTHTFRIPMRYIMKPTPQSVLELANAITLAWRDAVLDETYGEESK